MDELQNVLEPELKLSETLCFCGGISFRVFKQHNLQVDFIVDLLAIKEFDHQIRVIKILYIRNAIACNILELGTTKIFQLLLIVNELGGRGGGFYIIFEVWRWFTSSLYFSYSKVEIVAFSLHLFLTFQMFM